MIAKKLKFVAGFTMIELLVAMTLFSILMGIAAASFVKAIRTQRAIVALMAVNDNASLTLEQMTREMRTGYNFSISAGNDAIQFVNANNEIVSYRLHEGEIQRGVNSPISDVPSYEEITADNVSVAKLHFELLSGQTRPRITIAMSVTSQNNYLTGLKTNIQTTVSSRILVQ